jgi:cytochrome c-type biogenesis protein CcmH/NrfF
MILIPLCLIIIGVGFIVFVNHREESKKNEDRYKNIYSNENYYDDSVD